jgi:tetratricopeptide (TPR) repeat protein
MRTCAALLLLLAGAGGCAPAPPDPAELFASTTLAIRRGDFDAAAALADRGASLQAAADDGGVWQARFQLAAAEILLRKHDLDGAQQKLADLATSPDAVAARLTLLRGWTAMLAGTPPTLTAAINLFRTAADLADDDVATRLDSQVLLGVALYQSGRNTEGDAALQGVLATATELNDAYHQATAQLNLGFGLLRQRRYDAALAWFERVLVRRDLEEQTVYADALNNAGICYSRLGQFDRAVASQQRAVDRTARGTRREHEQALGQLGTTFIESDNVRASLAPLRDALSVASEAKLTADAAVWAGNLASAYVDLGQWDEAERSNLEGARLRAESGASPTIYTGLRAARIAAGRGLDDEARGLFAKAIEAGRSDPAIQWSAHEGLANLAIADGEPAVAARHFETALQIVERTRSDLLKTDYRLSFLSHAITFYRQYVTLLVTQGQTDRALEIADSSRGRVLAERQGGSTPSRINAAALRRIATSSKSVVLSYWLAPERSYLWVVEPAATHLVTLPPAATIDRLVRAYRAAIDNGMVDPLGAPGPGDELFQMIVQPALSWIRPGARVIVIPDGSLHGLNFETLPVASPQRHYLIEDLEMQIAPSLALLDGSRRQTAASRSILLVGNPTPREPEYPALKFAAAEMAGVAGHFPAGRSASLAGARALPAAYRTAHPEEFRFVHFTAHATPNVESPLDSAVILAGPDSAFKLYARDVAEQRLNAELVTVSACRSAGEQAYSGEGLIGFAWAFLRAGSKRVIAGLWDVDDQSTAALMDRLYGGIAAGRTISASLRDAKLALIAAGGLTARPYYWAPFELFTVVP